ATIDPETQGVIPEINGMEPDVEETIARLMQARPQTNIEPVFLEIPATVTLESFPDHPVYQGNPAKPQITFLINVAWGNEYLQEMLAVLQEADAQATFFLVGRWVRENKDMAKLIYEQGYEIASHGDSDALSMAQATKEEAVADIRRASDTIYEVCGIRPAYFSPHRGELSDRVLAAAAAEDARVVMWTVDTVDWMLPGVDYMVDKILDQAKGGSLILMHPTEQTAQFLRQVIPKLRKSGYEPVTLSTLLCPTPVNMDVISQ
ncbi:MAG: polysaccharide deacetylase family protein, partial [Bacillota bacterium]|nr:polysaccharide deacetylase family protein [Bacillota bacterium]